jgi:hypothetical protein
MTINPAFEGVPFLIPVRVHRSREAVAHATLADLAVLIGALPTAPLCLADADLFYADLDTAKAWARFVIRALPNFDMGDAEDGTC